MEMRKVVCARCIVKSHFLSSPKAALGSFRLNKKTLSVLIRFQQCFNRIVMKRSWLRMKTSRRAVPQGCSPASRDPLVRISEELTRISSRLYLLPPRIESSHDFPSYSVLGGLRPGSDLGQEDRRTDVEAWLMPSNMHKCCVS